MAGYTAGSGSVGVVTDVKLISPTCGMPKTLRLTVWRNGIHLNQLPSLVNYLSHWTPLNFIFSAFLVTSPITFPPLMEVTLLEFFKQLQTSLPQFSSFESSSVTLKLPHSMLSVLVLSCLRIFLNFILSLPSGKCNSCLSLLSRNWYSTARELNKKISKFNSFHVTNAHAYNQCRNKQFICEYHKDNIKIINRLNSN